VAAAAAAAALLSTSALLLLLSLLLLLLLLLALLLLSSSAAAAAARAFFDSFLAFSFGSAGAMPGVSRPYISARSSALRTAALRPEGRLQLTASSDSPKATVFCQGTGCDDRFCSVRSMPISVSAFDWRTVLPVTLSSFSVMAQPMCRRCVTGSPPAAARGGRGGG
jgi:hypothetical protein